MKPAVFKMLQDHLHGNRLPKHPAVCRHPKGGVPAKGHRAHVSLPPHLHHHAVYRGPSPGAVLQMLPNVQVASGGERSQLPVCFCAVRSGGGIPMLRNTRILPHNHKKRKGCSLSCLSLSQTQACAKVCGHKNRMWWNIQNSITSRRNMSHVLKTQWLNTVLSATFSTFRPSVLLQSPAITKPLINVYLIIHTVKRI